MSHQPSTYESIFEATGVIIQSAELLDEVFTHRSLVNEKSAVKKHNERLEFLGDAVLELVVTEHLFAEYPNPEGELTAWRSALVRGESLAETAELYRFGELLKVSRGEALSGAKAKNRLLANVFEAFLGALYLDQGYDVCKEFITRSILTKMPDVLAAGAFIDPKSRLQELTQESHGVTPIYQIVSEHGPDHAKEFIAQALLGTEVLGTGVGNSKQTAQVNAAADALRTLLNVNDQQSD
jgi:ribonuclease-3